MGVTTNIVATYRGPSRVMNRLLAMGRREDRVLAYLMGGCFLVFVSQLPNLARQAHLTGDDLDTQMAGALMAWIFIAPLLFYGLAALARGIGYIFGGRGTAFGARLALFWALLASTPVLLLYGLTAGFVGPGPALQAVGVLWCAVFVWFWISCSLTQERSA